MHSDSATEISVPVAEAEYLASRWTEACQERETPDPLALPCRSIRFHYKKAQVCSCLTSYTAYKTHTLFGDKPSAPLRLFMSYWLNLCHMWALLAVSLAE